MEVHHGDGAQWCAENQKAHPDWGPQHSMAAPAPDRPLMALNFCRKIIGRENVGIADLRLVVL